MRNKLRLATWIVCLLAIMVSFACVITAANNIVVQLYFQAMC